MGFLPSKAVEPKLTREEAVRIWHEAGHELPAWQLVSVICLLYACGFLVPVFNTNNVHWGWKITLSLVAGVVTGRTLSWYAKTLHQRGMLYMTLWTERLHSIDSGKLLDEIHDELKSVQD